MMAPLTGELPIWIRRVPALPGSARADVTLARRAPTAQRTRDTPGRRVSP